MCGRSRNRRTSGSPAILVAGLFLFGAGLSACRSPYGCDREFIRFERFDLPVGDCILIRRESVITGLPPEPGVVGYQDLVLRFVAVISDSRCPTDVRCVSPGSATVELECRIGNGEASRVVLRTPPDSSTQAIFGSYRIKLIGLAPFPVSTGRIDPVDYTGMFQVE